MGRQWGANELGSPKVTTLEEAVSKLNPAAKQAMYGAANKGLIRRGTWDGCAFNAGGKEVGKPVHSFQAAAMAFKLPVEIVHKFIMIWDRISGSDESATEKLKAAILKAGLFTEPNESAGRRILRETVYKSYETRMKEQFDSIVEGLDIHDASDELAVSVKGMGELLSVS